MTSAARGNVIPFLGPRVRPAPALDLQFEGTVQRVADIPPVELLDAAHLALTLATFLPGSAASYDCCMKALLCLARLADECRPVDRVEAMERETLRLLTEANAHLDARGIPRTPLGEDRP